MAGRNFLFVPGPTNVPDRILRAMAVPMEDHRSSKFPELTLRCLADLKKIFKTGSGTPMIPVEEGKTWAGWIFSSRASSMQTLFAASSPCFPVAQLALPEFTINAWTWPREARRLLRPTVSGAATTWF